MKHRWLLAAEADKIQDFVFRSSRLIEVAGGSSLLARFCATVPQRLLALHTGRPVSVDDADVIIAAGGGVRLAFDDAVTASAVGRDLAEAYYRATNGSLTVAEPQPYTGVGGTSIDGFAAAVEKAEASLREAKIDRRRAVSAIAHLPYIAFCSSCGVALATEMHARHERSNYHCRSCVQREAEREMVHEDPRQERFFGEYLAALRRTALRSALAETPTREMFPRDADEIARHDARGNVAYLVADGNGIGSLFGRCAGPDTMHRLSEALAAAMWDAVATATAAMVIPIEERLRGKDEGAELKIPVMPLIVGGDDLFVLMPAPYALDFAQHVCRGFETRLAAGIRDLGMGGDAHPTMTAVVVICKKGYPYTLAHRRGEQLLRRAKRLGRRAQIDDGLEFSMIDFAIVRGSDIALDADGVTAPDEVIRPIARPYWVVDGDLPGPAAHYALDFQRVLDTRYALRALPGKRRAELRELFTRDLPSGRDRDDVLVGLRTRWRALLDTLLNRIGERRTSRQTLGLAIDSLGDPSDVSGWRRYRGRDGQPFGHGLPDVLAAWDFALDLDKRKSDYDEEGA